MKPRFVWLAALLLAGCSVQLGGTGSPTPTGSVVPLADDAVVFDYLNAGGFCAPPGCYTARTYRADGRFDAVDTGNKVKRSGKIDAALVLALRREIAKADFKALRAIDRDKICGRIADAPDLTFTFSTGAGKETFKACSMGFDDGAIFAAARKLNAAADEALKGQPLDASPFRGVWAVATDASVKGPLAQDPCAKFRRFVFTAKDGVEGTEVNVTDANAGFQGFNFDYEKLTVRAGSASGTFVLSGQRFTPGPTDGPVGEPISYQLKVDDTKHLATGTRTLGTGKAEPVTLVETTAAAECPAGSPDPSTVPSAKPSASVSATPTTAPSGQPGQRVLVMARYGGLCPPGVTCGSETAFERDGRFVTTSGDKALAAGKVATALVDALVAEIAQADFTAIKAKPFTGTCPTAYDGQELTYTFSTPGGEQTLPSCTYDLPLDHPLFRAAQALENARQEQMEE